MLSNVASLRFFAPELVLAGGVVGVLLVGLLARRASRGLLLALAASIALASAFATALSAPGAAGGLALFGGLVVRDGFGDFFKIVFAGAGVLVAFGSIASREGRSDGAAESDRDAAEYAALILSVVLGADLMAAATDLLTAYLGLELVSMLSYALAAFARRSRRSAEAGLKYAIYGGVASGAMLYGFSWLYGLAASTAFGPVRVALAGSSPLVAGTILALVLAGLGFKMALVPFHSWAPDVYEGAPTPVAAFFSVVPKTAGFALAFRLLVGAGADPGALDASAAVAALVTPAGPATVFAIVLAAIATASMTLGNLAALGQRSVKRLLAYSSIAQAGNLAIALAVGTPAAARALLIYAAAYLFMSLGAFFTVAALVRAGEGESIENLAGLGRRAPALALAFTVLLFSLAGLPPLGGFVAKFAMFAAAVERGGAGGGGVFYALAAAGVVNTVVSLGYYAKLAKVMYFDPPPAEGQPSLALAPSHVALVGATALVVVALGLYAPPLASFAARSASLWPGP